MPFLPHSCRAVPGRADQSGDTPPDERAHFRVPPTLRRGNSWLIRAGRKNTTMSATPMLGAFTKEAKTSISRDVLGTDGQTYTERVRISGVVPEGLTTEAIREATNKPGATIQASVSLTTEDGFTRRIQQKFENVAGVRNVLSAFMSEPAQLSAAPSVAAPGETVAA